MGDVGGHVTDSELGLAVTDHIKGGCVAAPGVQDHVAQRALVGSVGIAQGNDRGGLRGLATNTQASDLVGFAVLVLDQVATFGTAIQDQRALGIQFLALSQLHSLETAGDAVLVLVAGHLNGRTLQAVGGDAGDIAIADSAIGIGLHRFTKVSTTEVQQAITCASFGGGKTLQSGKLLFGQLLAVQAVDFEGTTSIDLGLDLVECVLAQQLASVIKNDGLAQSKRTEVVDGDLCRSCVLILGNKLFVNGEAGRSRLSTHGERRALDLHIISHHVTMLDHDGGVRIHMEFFGCDRAAARNRKPAASGI